MANRAEVDLFLRQLKEKIQFFDIRFRPRDKNLIALAELDITAQKRLDLILSLQPEDYYAGPKRDTYDERLPIYYEFGIVVKGKTVYIKISQGSVNKAADCMSFHVAEFPMNYPLKTARR